MRSRTGPLVALVLASQALPADAARTVCRLVPDARGDARVFFSVPGTPTDDLVSADVASDGRTVTAVLRLADLQEPDPHAPLGRGYTFNFRLAGVQTRLYLTARTYPTGADFSYGYVSSDAAGVSGTYPLGIAQGTVDPARHEVRIHAPTSGFRARGTIRRGTRLVGLEAITYRWAGVVPAAKADVAGLTVPLGGVGVGVDRAAGGSYVVGTPSCVRPGR